jgi:hypothetical protein
VRIEVQAVVKGVIGIEEGRVGRKEGLEEKRWVVKRLEEERWVEKYRTPVVYNNTGGRGRTRGTTSGT